jgi:hypothetical protein
MENAYELMKEMYENGARYNKVRLTLKEPLVISRFSKKVKTNKRFDEQNRLVGYSIERIPKISYDLYIKQSTSGVYCFSNRENCRRVYPLWSLGIDQSKIEKLEFIKKDKNIDWDEKNRNYIVNNTHKNLWQSLVERLKQDDYKEDYLIKNNSHGRIKTASMKSKFPAWVVNELNDAIENKKDFRYSIRGTKRDLSVEVKLGEDGNLHAWYSSEYSGCGNGDYYLLINPTTAVFCETD